MDLKKLTDYIPYFEDKNTVFYEWKESVTHSPGGKGWPFPKYSPKLMEFVNVVYESGIMHKDYVSALKEIYAKHPNLNSELLSFIETADLDSISVILTKCIRVERFSDGAWCGFCDDKIFLALLLRLKILDESIAQDESQTGR